MPEDDTSSTVRRWVVVRDPYGLGTIRSSTRFVKLANTFAAEIQVYRDGRLLDGKSILDVTMIAAECGEEIDLEARGTDAEQAVAALAELLSVPVFSDPYAQGN